jgi:Cu(I)/Ag(I) efflux system membrane fusion protein
MPGRITRLFADTTFTEVRAGDHLFEIYSPQLLEVQNDYLTAVKNRSRGGFEKQLYESTRKKLLLYGLRPSQLRAIEAAGKPSDLIIIRAPKSGTIFERHLSEGDYVKEGSPLYTIADYSTLWLFFDAYETDLPWIAVGQKVTLTLDAQPGRVYAGLVEFINPVVDEQTRTTKVRVVLDNPSLTLKAGMFANVEIVAQLAADGTAAAPTLAGRYGCYMHPEVHLDSPGRCPICGMRVELRASDDDEQANEARPVLTIPRSAVLDTGARQLVYVMSQPPKWEKHGEDWVEVAAAEFESREVTLGAYAGQDVMVGDGLREGEIVVTRGNFLIDSQMELLGKPSLLHAEGSASSFCRDHRLALCAGNARRRLSRY